MKRFRFSLRGLLTFVFVLAVLLSIGSIVSRYQYAWDGWNYIILDRDTGSPARLP